MIRLQRKFSRITIIVVLLLAIAGGALLAQQANAPDGQESEGLRNVLEVIALLKAYHVEDVGTFDFVRAYLQKGTINGMLRETLNDDYTRYMDPRAFARTREDTVEGEFGGIGIMVGMRNERLTVIAPIVGTPGFRAGLRGGDLITKVDEYPTDHMSLDEAVSLMRGVIDTEVELTIARGDEELVVPIVRGLIQVQSVEVATVITPHQVPSLPAPVGYIQLSNFNEKTMGQMNEALLKLQRGGMQGLIFDLRNNGGGLLNTALELADRFVADGPLLHVVDANKQRTTYVARQEGTLPALPIVVLVNEFSASASEILAGALRDNDVAVLVGTTTFGKGSVQTVVPLKGGAGLAVTTAHYETAGGHFIHGTGIEPDVLVEMPEEDMDAFYDRLDSEDVNLDDVQLQKALEVLSDLLSAIRPTIGTSVDTPNVSVLPVAAPKSTELRPAA